MFEFKQAEDEERYQKLVQEKRMMKCLAGLTIEYDSIKNQLSGQNPFPTVEEAHGLEAVDSTEAREEALTIVRKEHIESATSTNECD
ncbi:hypothetical protein AgCh_008490 [Apium graveolens]